MQPHLRLPDWTRLAESIWGRIGYKFGMENAVSGKAGEALAKEHAVKPLGGMLPARFRLQERFARLPLTTRVWIQVLALIVLPSLALAIGAAGVAFKRTWYDSKQFLTQLAVSEAAELGASIDGVASVVAILADRDGLGSLGSALSAGDHDALQSKMDRLSAYLFGLRQVAAVVVVNSGAVSYQKASARHSGVLGVPLIATDTSGSPGAISAIGSAVSGQHYLRLTFPVAGWSQSAALQVFVAVDAPTGRVRPHGEGRAGSGTLIVRDTGRQSLKQIAWGAGGSTIVPAQGSSLEDALGAAGDVGADASEDTLGAGYFGAVSRVPGQDAYVAMRMAKRDASLAPMVTAGVTLATVLLVSVLVAMRLGNVYLSTIDVVRDRSQALIRKIDPQWSGDADSVEVLVEIFEKLDEVVQGHSSKLNREIESRAQAIEMIQLRLIEASRMAAVGEIAGGVMHEVGQPLNVLLLMLDDIEEQANGGSVTIDAQSLVHMRQAVQRILTIQEGIRHRARPLQRARRKMDLGHVVTSTNSLYKIHAKLNGIALVEVVASERPIFVDGNETEISQCVSNLMVNSVEALKDFDGGRKKEIRTRLEAVDGWAVLTVEDNGPGMSRDAINRAFEVGFTTKAAGTGFGLNMCKRYVEVQHKGKISIDSVEGAFTKVTVRLPLFPDLDA